MNEKEMQELIQNAFQKTAKELKESPDNVFNYLELQEKYNSVLKDKMKLKRENKQLREAINKIYEIINYEYDFYGDVVEMKNDLQSILKEVE